MNIKSLFAATMLSLSVCALPATASAEEVFDAPVAARQAKETGLQTAIFAGGCFWGIEGIFSHTRGVTSAVAGYHGGNSGTATYRQVSSGMTEHAEAVRVTYDPSVVRYDQLLQILFSVGADPTLHNRQGPDRGPQYRAAIVPVTAEQRAVAQAYVAQMERSGVWDKPMAVKVEKHRRFYEAEANHQDYMLNNPNSGYIRRWDAPKVEALQEHFPQLYRARFRTG
ncbi:peptide-methionine (S)-S-oxide reductase MsrA [Aurantiacibacter rhizosphaerae]|uniref:Peptide methionine sulfoxide reductase MsrA n=1 Tax=Aurantiacibacter rhizosphaerae TaxID=2691582 RepID=A0A844X9W1_9SPHN|nr:peptide-methionine (S)-S-oxide reductase MsrA [Aurantiacibacter rhizosphaerae]MWV26464.1 peptide-methionine (S)-S-oxide reductase MsrA [Aurantiacibacter rhizosphaerae]